MNFRVCAAAVLVTLTAAGCSSGNDDAPSTAADTDTGAETSTAGHSDPFAAYPACDEVWVVGQHLPEDYDGCVQDDTLVANSAFPCKAGDQQLASYEDRLWVLTPGTIEDAGQDTATDPAYADAYSECIG